MGKIIMLGNRAAVAKENYNTCFLVENNNKYLLVDTGCSDRIIDYLNNVNVDVLDIHDIFITHKHIDHLLGLFWLMRHFAILKVLGKYDSKINVYCHSELKEVIETTAKLLFRDIQYKSIMEIFNIIVVDDGSVIDINDCSYRFFDCKCRSVLIYGFDTVVDGKRIVFFGDEKCDESYYDSIKNCDYVIHEVFCKEADREYAGIGLRAHSTLEEVCEKLSGLGIKNLILCHSKYFDSSLKKDDYESIGNSIFDGNLIFPEECEVIKL